MKLITTLAIISASAMGAQAAVVFSDDFESYNLSDPAAMSPNWAWNGNGTAPNASRIFNTPNFGGSRLWIANAGAARAGSGINSTAVIALDAATDYVFSAALVTETDQAGRTATGTVTLLVDGATVATQAFTARGDGTGADDNTYEDQMTTFDFNSGAGGNLEIRIAFDDADGSNPFVGIDNVGVETAPVPEPSSAALLGLGGLALILRRRK